MESIEGYTWQRLAITREDSIVTVALNRPDKRNALDFITFQELDRASRWLRRDRTLRGVILTSTSEHFSSGLDIHSVVTSPSRSLKLLAKLWPMQANLAQRVVVNWQKIPAPVVAVIQGHCLGGAMQLALGADLRFAAHDATFSIMEVQWGLLPDMGGLVNLRDILSKDQALKLSLSGELVDADQAQRLGLCSWVGDNPMEQAKGWLVKVSSRSPDAVAAIKCSYNKGWHSSAGRLLWRETLLQLRLVMSKNFRIANKRQRQQSDAPYQPRGRW
jgi:enoyl-CoA hydratase/carnithine racemase